jgi:NAD-dependent deacetylase
VMLETIVKRLRAAGRVVVFTGAGVSAESGIPTFRDALTGLWENFDASRLATAEAFRADPSLVWGWYEWRRLKVVQAQPNSAHTAIAELAKHVPHLTVITQNVDDLHERAGSQDVVHLHGSLHSPRCIDCSAPLLEALPTRPIPEGGVRIDPPHCRACGGLVRPGVVWFGEMLPQAEWATALAASEDCNLLLSVGTSGVVYPAAELPLRALGKGATIVHVNPVSFDVSAQEVFMKGRASEQLQELINSAFGYES